MIPLDPHALLKAKVSTATSWAAGKPPLDKDPQKPTKYLRQEVDSRVQSIDVPTIEKLFARYEATRNFRLYIASKE